MTVVRAEEYTQALGQVVFGSWRQIARAKKLGIPQALGLSLEDWVTSRLGGYVRLSVADRREAVQNLKAEGYSVRDTAEILGVSHGTVGNDVQNWTSHSEAKEPTDKDTRSSQAVSNATAAFSAPDRFGRTTQKHVDDDVRLGESVARAHAAVVAVLPVLETGVRLEFYSRALSLAANLRGAGDGDAVRQAAELIRELAGARPAGLRRQA
jgi:hypothetical protein